MCVVTVNPYYLDILWSVAVVKHPRGNVSRTLNRAVLETIIVSTLVLFSPPSFANLTLGGTAGQVSQNIKKNVTGAVNRFDQGANNSWEHLKHSTGPDINRGVNHFAREVWNAVTWSALT